MAVYVAEQFHKNTLKPRKYKWMLNPLNSLSKNVQENTTNCNLHCVGKTKKQQLGFLNINVRSKIVI